MNTLHLRKDIARRIKMYVMLENKEHHHMVHQSVLNKKCFYHGKRDIKYSDSLELLIYPQGSVVLSVRSCYS